MIHLFTGAILKLQYIIERRISYAQNQREQKQTENHQRLCISDCREAKSITSLTNEVASITANIDTLKADLKEKKTALKSTQKELMKLESKKAAANQKAAEAAKKNEAENLVKKLLADGVSADDIIEKLK